jgi:hypothetical protein
VLPLDVRGRRPFISYAFETDFERFLRGIPASPPARTLEFLHVSVPHATWRTLPSGREYQDPTAIDGIEDDRLYNKWTTSRWLVDQSLQAHLLQVGYTDRLVGELISRLEARSLYDRALVIVTADHGASFKAGGSRRVVQRNNLADVAGVPLFVKYPGQRQGRVDGRDAKTIDIVPTIADVEGVRIPWHVDGVSLRGAPESRPVSVSSSHGDPVVAAPAAVAAGVLATARRNAALFGVGRDSMYRLGPFEELHGKSIESFAAHVVPAGAAGVTLDDAQVYANVRPSSGFVPARVAGEITGGSIEQGTALAIAVNGRVEATTRSYRLDGHSRFVTLVPERAFHDGRNSVRIYALKRTTGPLRVQSLGGTPYAPGDAHLNLASQDPIASASGAPGGRMIAADESRP